MKPNQLSTASEDRPSRGGAVSFFSSLAGIGLLLGLAAENVGAQIEVGLELDRKTYMAHEGVSATLRMTNRSGVDLILDGKNGDSWLDFHVTDPRGQSISPLRNREKEKPLVLKNGVLFEKRVFISSHYPMGATGQYAVKAQIWFPPLKQYFESNRSTLAIVEGQLLKRGSHTVGVPPGFVGAGNYRTFQLLTFFQGARERLLYLRLIDAATGVVRQTYSLGPYIAVHEPQHAVDSKSQLHVLHLNGPQVYRYNVIDPAGKVVMSEVFRDHNGNRPVLIANNVTGDVAVKGGISESETQTPYEQREFPKLSERPPGIPLR